MGVPPARSHNKLVEAEMPVVVRFRLWRSHEIGVSEHRESSPLVSVPGTAFSIDTDFKPAPKVNVLSATLIMYSSVHFSKALA